MRIGVLTSGGDAPGMNAAVRAAVRTGLASGAEVFAVREGYAGLVEGGSQLAPYGWGDVSNILQLGGTTLGSARCAEFRTTEGRRAAVRNALAHEVSRLLIIGGDGSLTGAEVLRREWPDHVAALVSTGAVSRAVAAQHPSLLVVGVVGSIDNDMWGTDMTIGCDSALHRVVDAMDTLTSTARSHQRSFVIEVMGRRSGYLALAAAICGGADYVLLPEAPEAQWQSAMCAAISASRAEGKRKSLVMLAEGACDVDGQPISAEQVRAAIESGTGIESRITNLGHVQRGGTPSAYDRVMSTLLGARGASELLTMQSGDEPRLMCTRGYEVFTRPLTECVAQSQTVAVAIEESRFADAVAARGTEFAELLPLFQSISTTRDLHGGSHKRLLVAHVGAPAPGMNAAVRVFARAAAAAGHVPLVALDGLRGLLTDQLRQLDWLATEDIASLGGTAFGTNRWWPRDGERTVKLDAALTRNRIDGVVLVGGFECLRTAAQLETMGLPVAVVPATISNNVPGTDRSLGADTAENAICESVDRLKLSAVGSRRRVFVVEVMGRACGYLATLTGIGTGAEIVCTHESGISLEALLRETKALSASFDDGRQVGIVLMADGTSATYDPTALARILEAESGGRFDTRVCMLGHLQQGGRPSPRDRIAAARLAARAVEHAARESRAVVLGLAGDEVIVTSCRQALEAADMVHRRPLAPSYPALAEQARELSDVQRVAFTADPSQPQ